MEKGCDRLLTSPISGFTSDYPLFLHAVSTSGNPSDPRYLVRTTFYVVQKLKTYFRQTGRQER